MFFMQDSGVLAIAAVQLSMDWGDMSHVTKPKIPPVCMFEIKSLQDHETSAVVHRARS